MTSNQDIMNKIKFTLIWSLLLLILASCEKNTEKREEIEVINDKEVPAEESAQKALNDEVIAIHDEAMAKLEEMMNLKGQLIEQIELQREQGEEIPMDALERAIDQLEQADEAMMDWMRNFKLNYGGDTLSQEIVISYYQEKLASIKQVKEDINTALEQAEEKLDSLQQTQK